MNHSEERKLLCEYGRILSDKGLVARTWGNLSIRTGGTMFITPSGLAYEELTPDDIVAVKLYDMTWTGQVKPSSEKELHSNVYRANPGITAVFHTHQNFASVLAATRKGYEVDDEFTPILGSFLPCADYALPTTHALAEAVAHVLDSKWYPAVLLANHGAVCAGPDARTALDTAVALEAFSQKVLLTSWRKALGAEGLSEQDLGELTIARGGRIHA